MTMMIVLATLAAMYDTFVGVCVVGRMTASTSHLVRTAVVILTGLGGWAIIRTISGEWDINLISISHACAVVIGASILALCPRIPT